MKKRWVKLSFDFVMAVTFVLLFQIRTAAGLQFHEIAGLLIGAAFLFHIFFNRRWVVQVTKHFFDGHVSAKTKIGYLTDVFLLFSMAVTILTGIAISKVVFPNHLLGSGHFRLLHSSFAYLTLAFVGVHIGLHWDWILKVVKRKEKTAQSKRSFQKLAGVLAAAVFAFGVYNMVQVHYFTGLSAAFANSGFSEKAQSQVRGNKDRIALNESVPNTGGGHMNRQRENPVNSVSSQSGNALQVLCQYLSILFVFLMTAFCIEKFIKCKRMKV